MFYKQAHENVLINHYNMLNVYKNVQKMNNDDY